MKNAHRYLKQEKLDETRRCAAGSSLFGRGRQCFYDAGKKVPKTRSRPDAFYLAIRDKGLFRSIDGGKQWTLFTDEVIAGDICAIAAIKNTVFVGTNRGLYRWHSGTGEKLPIDTATWEKLPIDTTNVIYTVSVSGDHLYVSTGADLSQLGSEDGMKAYIEKLMNNADSGVKNWEVFHSVDLGDSWTEITPTSESPMGRLSSGVQVLAVKDAVMVLGMLSFRSTDFGKTWTEFGYTSETLVSTSYFAVAADEKTLFKAGASPLKRSLDGGKTWHLFTDGIVGTRVRNLVAFKNELYTSTSTGIIKSADNGNSWDKLPTNSGEVTLKDPKRAEKTAPLIFPQLTIDDTMLYGITYTLFPEQTLSILQLSTNGNVFVQIPGTPRPNGASEKNIMDMGNIASQLDRFPSAFAVSDGTFYVEYERRLLRWKRGESAWFDTGLVDTAERSDKSDSFMKGVKLAVSGQTVYVGKRDGTLFQSFDSGDTWKALTSNLPLRFKHFNEIVFAGSTVYVATDTGVLTSEDGEHWGVVTDTAEDQTVIDRMAVAGMTVYGAGAGGVYRLNNRKSWEQISPEVPDSVISLVINSDRFYIATEHRGMFYVSLEKAW